MILVDTSALLANYDRGDLHHRGVSRALAQSTPPRIVSPLVVAELGYLIHVRLGRAAQLEALADIGSGAYVVPHFDSGAVAEAVSVLRQYKDLDLGVTDASIVVLSGRNSCHELLTLDHRHFRAVVGGNGRPFRLLPADDGTPAAG